MEPKPTINVNIASAEEFRHIGGLAPGEAEAIVDWRSSHGPFQSFDELRQVPGLDEKAFRKLLRVVDFGKE